MGNPVGRGRVVTIDPSVADLLLLEFGDHVIRKIAPLSVEERAVRWRPGMIEVVAVRTLVADLADVVAAIESSMGSDVETLDANVVRDGYEATIDATGRSAEPLLSSGVRTAFCWGLPSDIKAPRVDLGASRFGGWAFVAPAPDGSLSVQQVCPGSDSPELRLRAGKIASHVLSSIGYSAAAEAVESAFPIVVDATPSFDHPVGQDNTLRVGDRAAAGDPLAGDGVGRAVRSAVLAAAVLLGPRGSRKAALSHYAARVAAAHAVHLWAAANLYEQAACSAAFEGIVRLMRRDARFVNEYSLRQAGSLRLEAGTESLRLVEGM
ncbi:hypothetical protein [Sinorhizobium medicae]|uniref:hypothetical protein n=1 Tax=Sinorhizobium medicae TaxID=110321 RepID=UPI000FD8AC2F|nr:hypothetical protein [Sinorhizobium medicae]RVJ72535.1 hypothetical protein CN168_26700 [Sinorhizobium medicae]